MISARPSLLEWTPTVTRPTDVESLLAEHVRRFAYYGSGKAALYDGLSTLRRIEARRDTGSRGVDPNPDNVVLPAYLPDAVVEPIRECGLEPRQYAITERLAPDVDDLEARIDEGTLAVVSVNYFGFPQPGFDDIVALADRHGCYHVEDNAHGALSFADGRLLGTRGDIGFTSLWKLLPIPDGAALFLNDQRLDAAYEPSSLAGTETRVDTGDVQFVLKSFVNEFLESNRRLRASVHRLITENAHGSASNPSERYQASKSRMSWLSSYVVSEADPTEIRTSRRSNYRAWASLFDRRPDVTVCFDSLPPGVCPQVCPVRTDHPDRLRRLLERHGVGGTHTWPRLSRDVLEDSAYETAHRLSEEVVVLPVHQHVDPETIVAIGSAIEDAHE